MNCKCVQCAECQGTYSGVQDEYASEPHKRISVYRVRYANCTTVKSNLEIVHFYEDFDLSFLENIREVHGYVLVLSSLVSRIPLTSLRVIRGRRLFRNRYSLFVMDYLNSGPGLRDLELPNLVGE